MRPEPKKKQATLRLRVTAAAESTLRAGHPWLFADSVREQNRPGEAGELAVVFDRKDRFLAAGLFDPDSPIRLRVLLAGRPQTIDNSWWSARLERAFALRKGLFDEKTSGFRWINGESDGWPGLVLDQYDRTQVLKLYTPVWLPRLGSVVDLIDKRLRPHRIVLRLSRNVRQRAEEEYSRVDGEVLKGPEVSEPVRFLEHGIRFEADVLRGQKTGFFLDQRENRRRVEALAMGRLVLNAFSFSGAFSVYAARGGASAVTDLDISAHALAAANRNFALNPSALDCPRETVQADAFAWLSATQRRFSLVILDPPSLAKREPERARAIRAYGRLARLGFQCLSPGGILVACSCSAHVTESEFFQAVRNAGRETGRTYLELETTAHAPDHPATFKEARYLKAIFLEKRE